MKKLPKHFAPRREKLDAFDLEAEAEGRARHVMRDAGPAVLGRRISRERRKLDGAEKTVDKRATDNLVRDHAAIYNKVVTSPLNLKQ